MSRFCPICLTNKLTRTEVKTCGAPDCISIWKKLNAKERTAFIQKAAEKYLKEQNEAFERALKAIRGGLNHDS